MENYFNKARYLVASATLRGKFELADTHISVVKMKSESQAYVLNKLMMDIINNNELLYILYTYRN